MNLLELKLKSLKKNKYKALTVFITAGYPDMKATYNLIGVLEQNGVDIIELGVPFSDPIADGPTIQYSSECALRKGANLDAILYLVKKVRRTSQIPLLLMTYLNPINHPGLEKTFKRAKDAGVNGFIIPDTIPEESSVVERLAKKNGLSLVYLVAPNTPQERLRYIDKKSGSFVYVVSLTGVTGKRKSMPAHIKEFLLRVKKNIRHPKFLGFGISNDSHVKLVKKYVDGVIVGSAIIDIIRNNKSAKLRNRKVAQLVRSLKKALKKRGQAARQGE